MDVLLRAPKINFPLLLSAAARSFCSAGHMCGSGSREIRIISQKSHSTSMSTTGGIFEVVLWALV